MILVKIDLFRQIKKAEKQFVSKGALKKEKWALFTIILAFELGFFFRFLFYLMTPSLLQTSSTDGAYTSYFKFLWIRDLDQTFDLLTFFAFLAFQLYNYRLRQ